MTRDRQKTTIHKVIMRHIIGRRLWVPASISNNTYTIIIHIIQIFYQELNTVSKWLDKKLGLDQSNMKHMVVRTTLHVMKHVLAFWLEHDKKHPWHVPWCVPIDCNKFYITYHLALCHRHGFTLHKISLGACPLEFFHREP